MARGYRESKQCQVRAIVAFVLVQLALCVNVAEPLAAATSEETQETKYSAPPDVVGVGATDALQSEQVPSDSGELLGNPPSPAPSPVKTEQGATVIEIATQNAVAIIQLAALVVAASLFVFTISSAIVAFLYRSYVKRQMKEVQEAVDRAKSSNAQLQKRLAHYDATFSQYMADIEKTRLAQEAARHASVLSDPNSSSDAVVPAITYLGERGNCGHIPLILNAARRFADDDELWEFATDAVTKLSDLPLP